MFVLCSPVFLCANRMTHHNPVSLREGRVETCPGLVTSFCWFSRHQTHLWLAAALQTSMMAFFQIFWACIASWSSLQTELGRIEQNFLQESAYYFMVCFAFDMPTLIHGTRCYSAACALASRDPDKSSTNSPSGPAQTAKQKWEFYVPPTK